MPSVNKQQSRIRVAKEFKKNHSREKLQYLIQGLQINTSGQVLADSIGVSRERIRQWKDIFGDEIFVFTPKKVTLKALDGVDVKNITTNNFIKKYNFKTFKQFISALVNHQSGELWAKKLKITRERVRQFKNKFGTSSRTYSVYPEIIAEMRKK